MLKDYQSIQQTTEKVINEAEKIIMGKTAHIRTIVMAILAEGHILLEDIPGVGKTTLIKTLSRVLGCQYKRIQFTPDLLPSDIVGVNTYNQKTADFCFIPGPVMTNILLADEINRAIPRTQAALLEAMEEKQITVDGMTRSLPEPFIVMATQNPIETEGTFLLPIAQMDRFMIRLTLGYPSKEEEGRMLKTVGDEIPFAQLRALLDPEMMIRLQHKIRDIHLSDAVICYILEIIQATRNHPLIRIGASPRASRALFKCSKVWAALHSREFVIPDDVQAIVVPVLNHRLLLKSEAKLLMKTTEEVINEIMTEIAVPPAKGEILNAR